MTGPTTSTPPHPWREPLALLVLLVVAWLLWQPGLSGGWLFDDDQNLLPLEDIAAEPGLYRAAQYLFGGIASDLGRPLSLATFALQYAAWPADPAAFLRVNLFIHLANGLLLFAWLARWRALAAADAPASAIAPLAVTALWLLSPLQVAAVLYVVQRMTLLAGTCVLAGLLLHTAGRQTAASGRLHRGYLLMTAGAAVGLGLGVLAKESAALYPVLVLVFEATLLRQVARPPHWRPWAGVVLAAPIALLLAYLLWRAPGFAAAYGDRPFTAGERLLTEARVLFVYLGKLLAPTPYGVRLLYDDYPTSTSLLQPWTTLPAVLGWLTLLGGAWRWRARWPVGAFGVLWFLGAHLLESTLLPLELVFEHRNYVAAVGPLLALAVGAAQLAAVPRWPLIRRVTPAAGVLYLALTAGCLWQATRFWGDPFERTRWWALRQPESVRAMHDLGTLLFNVGRVDAGRELYERAVQRWPGDATLPFTLVNAGCDFPRMPVPSPADLRAALARMDAHVVTFIGTLKRLVEAVEAGRCARYPLAELRGLLDAALQVQHLRHERQNLLLLASRLAEVAGDRPAAMRQLDQALRLHPVLPILRQAVEWSIQGDDLPAARAYLEMVPGLPWRARWTWRKEIAGLHQLVDLYARATSAPSP